MALSHRHPHFIGTKRGFFFIYPRIILQPQIKCSKYILGKPTLNGKKGSEE
jgi:hypothetical protein